MAVSNDLTIISNVATAVGMGLVVWQLALQRRQLKDSFERTFAERYERTMSQIAFHHRRGEPLTDMETVTLEHFCRYFGASDFSGV